MNTTFSSQNSKPNALALRSNFGDEKVRCERDVFDSRVDQLQNSLVTFKAHFLGAESSEYVRDPEVDFSIGEVHANTRSAPFGK